MVQDDQFSCAGCGMRMAKNLMVALAVAAAVAASGALPSSRFPLVFLAAFATLTTAWTLKACFGGGGAKEGMGSVGDPPPGAIVAETLSDFDEVDNSLVFPRGAAPEIDNITQVAPRTFRFVLRHRGNPWTPLNPGGTRGAWYDGDRDLEWNEGKRDGRYHDKSRAEVNGLGKIGTKKGPQMKAGDTWDIATTVKLAPDFRPSAGYCPIMQPVFDQSFLNLVGVEGDFVTANMTVFTNGIGSEQKVVRSFKIKRNEWTSIVVRIKFGTSGSYACSVNGDTFKSLSLDTTKGRQPFRSKWGLYGSATKDTNGDPLGDSIVEHRNVYIRKVA